MFGTQYEGLRPKRPAPWSRSDRCGYQACRQTRRTGCRLRRGPATAKLLGGHGDDSLHAGPWGDVLWADYKPSGQPSTQHDQVFGGPGNDFIYAGHGANTIAAGGGDDYVKVHFGRGSIDCGGGRDILYVSRRATRHYTIRGCERVSHKTLGR